MMIHSVDVIDGDGEIGVLELLPRILSVPNIYIARANTTEQANIVTITA